MRRTANDKETPQVSDEWISTRQAAVLLGVAESTVYRWLADEAVRKEMWGAEGAGWRYKPIIRRRVYQVSRNRAAALAEGGTTG